MKPYYAMMIDLTGKRCLVVGGGVVAERKVTSLLEAGADVVVVSPTVTPKLADWADEGQLVLHSRFYQSGDGEGATLVIAATDDQQVNHLIYQEANQRGQWVNVVDQPALCNFTVPSTVHRGKLQIAISTHGASPSLAKQIRQELEETYGDEYELLLDLLQEARLWLQREVQDARRRKNVMRELVADGRWLELCRRQPNQVKERMWQWLDQQISVRI